MPAGFGYGAIGKVISSVQRGAGRYAKEAAKVGAPGAGVAKYFAGMSHAGVGAVTGATMGGMYGAVSGDTSVLGGMMAGAAMGGAGIGGWRGVARYGGRYAKARARGLSRSGAAEVAYRVMASDTTRLIGQTKSRVINPIMSTLKTGVRF